MTLARPKAARAAFGLPSMMRPLRTVVLLLVALGAISLWPSLVCAQPRASLGSTEHDFGGVRRGDQVAWTFDIRNTGDTPLELTSVRLSMPGMTAKVPPKIGPGATGAIVIGWKTDRIRGAVRGMVTVDTNDPSARNLTLVLAGTVRAPLDIEPVAAIFLSAFQGEDAHRELTLRSNQPGPVSLRLDGMAGKRHVAELAATEPGRVWRLTVRAAPGTLPGRYEDTLTLTSDDAAIGTTRLAVHLFVKADVYANPDEIDFGELALRHLPLQADALRFMDQLVIIRKRAGTFRVRGVRSDVGAVHVRATPAASESTSFRIDAGLRPDRLEPGSLDGTIWIDTDDPQFPRLAVRVRGRIVDR